MISQSLSAARRYDRLLAGEGRSETMRQAQLARLRADETARPGAAGCRPGWGIGCRPGW